MATMPPPTGSDPNMERMSDAIEKGVKAVFGTAIAALFLMLAMQAANELWPGVPAAGYVTCFMLLIGVQAIGYSLRAGIS